MFNFSEKIEIMSDKALQKIKPQFEIIDQISDYNSQKLLKAFIDHGVSEAMFTESTGYGYSDKGRETIDKVFAQAVGAEDSIVRHNFTCGTHTLSVALFGVLRPNDKMLCVTGLPYDTLHSIIGISGNKNDGSLMDFGVQYEQIDLLEDGSADYAEIEKRASDDYKMVYIQRSRGYSLRPSLKIEEIAKIIKIVKSKSNSIVMVDNCYGEWTQLKEPTQVGADLMAGSLIKNPGGGIAKTGGYIAGKKELVDLCSYRLITPGLGREVGATLGQSREMYLGIYMAPQIVAQALKTAVYVASLFEQVGFESVPKFDAERGDIVQSILLENAENLIAFCQGIQKGSPIDSFVVPEPWEMPGYDSKVIMAAGAFTLGSSIELSADAPLREPYAVWLQGGLNFHTSKVGVKMALENLLKTMGKL